MRLEELVLTDYPKVRNGGNVDRGQLSVMHADAEVEAKILAAELEKKLDIVNVPIFLLPPAVVVHAGPGVLAVAYFV
jgi:fatty acid-binding protein DegV